MIELEKLFWDIAINDDRKAYRTLFDMSFSSLCLYAKQYIRERTVIEDLVQDVFVALWENRKKIKIKTSVRNYLLVSVRNQCFSYLKREGYKEQYLELQLSETTDASVYEDFYLSTELQEMLDKALAKLPETYRIVFEMSRMEEKTHAEIAEQLHIPLRTVERYKAKVISILKDELKDYLFFFF